MAGREKKSLTERIVRKQTRNQRQLLVLNLLAGLGKLARLPRRGQILRFRRLVCKSPCEWPRNADNPSYSLQESSDQGQAQKRPHLREKEKHVREAANKTHDEHPTDKTPLFGLLGTDLLSSEGHGQGVGHTNEARQALRSSGSA